MIQNQELMQERLLMGMRVTIRNSEHEVSKDREQA